MYVGEVHEDSRKSENFRRMVAFIRDRHAWGCALKMHLAKRDLDLIELRELNLRLFCILRLDELISPLLKLPRRKLLS